MLWRVVTICAVSFGYHLIVAADSDIPADDSIKNETFTEELSTFQPKIEPRAENEDVDKNEQRFCLPPPDIEGVISPDKKSDQYPLGTIISYQCKFGYASRSSGSLLSVCKINVNTGKTEWTHPNTTCIPRSCGDPGYVVNGRRIGNLFTFPNNVKFECLEGYKLQGLKDRYCQANGEWSGRLPTCTPIRCPVPNSLQNGRVRYISLEYGSELQYECDKGFMLKNYEPRICNGEGVWSNNEPECIETSCGIPEAPEYGTIQLSDVEPKVGTLAFYNCDESTTLLGASTSKCLPSGDWTFDPPKCLRFCYVSEIQDGELGQFHWNNRNRRVFISLRVGEIVKHQEKVILRCKDGYSPRDKANGRTQEVECNDGTWSEPLYCQQMECREEPPSTENASPIIESRSHGSTIWYQCDPGYKKVKTGGVVCKYGKWEGLTPVCADYRCYMKDLNFPGLLKPQMNFIKDTEHFKLVCDHGYKEQYLKKHISCVEGQWDLKRNPCILKICEEEPPSINNGIIKEFKRMNGSFVDYECEEGYEMIGESPVQCVLGTWIGQPPDCKLLTQNLTTPSLESENSSVLAESLNTNLTRLQPEECFCTYNFQDDFMRMFWRNVEVPSNVRIAKGDNVLLNCRYNAMDIVWPNGLRFYEKMGLVCDTCQDWQEHDLPHCEARVAGDSFIAYDEQLKIKPGGVIEVPESEKISLACINPWIQPIWNVTREISFPEDPRRARQTTYFRNDIIIRRMDYKHVGRYECFGLHFGQKLRSTVVDLKIQGSEALCPDLLTETNNENFNIIYSNGRKVNSIAYYACKDPSKRTVGSYERRCLENGEWSDSYPACEDIRCPSLNENNMFFITYNNNRKVNSVAFYQCRTVRQRLIGSSNRTCLHSGEWSGTNPLCEDITCPEFSTYNGLSVTYSRGTKVGSIASFSCLNHATLVGSPDASCLYNGTWSVPRPSCELLEIICPKINGKGIFSIKYNNHRRVNGTATFFCKGPKQKVAGCNFMTCQENGEWSGDYPTCVDYVSCELFPTLPNMKVFYTDDGKVGSVASFQCLYPTSLIGSSTARCLLNGTWSRSLPTCAEPNCTIEDFDNFLKLRKLDALHANLQNITDDFLIPGSELPLICEENFVLTGSSKAVCNSLGEWDIKDAQCISACRVNKNETSLLTVEPVKDYYRFAEFILLSCPPGQKLTSEVQRMMCLGKTWSDPLPDCIEVTEPNTSEAAEITTKSD